MRIEITEPGGIKDGREQRGEGDIITVDDAKGQQWVDLGWARNVDTGEQGERKPGAQRIDPAPIVQQAG